MPNVLTNKREIIGKIVNVLVVDYAKSFGCCVCDNGDVFIATEGAVPFEVEMLMIEHPEIELMYVGTEPTIIVRGAIC